jgi:anti-sigma regulatory factor (Ser/Thr protein kinase)
MSGVRRSPWHAPGFPAAPEPFFQSTGKKAIVEGRDAIQHLRREAPHSDLEHLLRTAGQEIASSQILNDHRPIFRVTVEGRQQALSAPLQDELYKIGRELLRNAFQHASASRIEAEIRYGDRLFHLRIRDDGKGMDRKVLQEGTVPDQVPPIAMMMPKRAAVNPSSCIANRKYRLFPKPKKNALVAVRPASARSNGSRHDAPRPSEISRPI